MVDRTEDREKFWEAHEKESYECPECGRGFEEVDGFEVHHIDKHAKNGQMDNLVGLCVECHHEIHDIKPGHRPGHWSERFYNPYQSDENPLKYL